MGEKKVHFKDTMWENYSICGVCTMRHTLDVSKVTCGNCRNTRAYQEAVKELANKVESVVLKSEDSTCGGVDAREYTFEVMPTIGEPKEVIESIEKKILDAIWEVSGGGVGGNLPCMIIGSSDNYVLCLEEQEPERFFKITVTEMELVEKRSNEG